MKKMGLVILIFAFGAYAQTVTNYIKAAENFRRVDGKLYNTDKSYLFVEFRGKIVERLTNGIVMQTSREEKQYITLPADPLVENGNFLGGSASSGQRRRLIRTDEIPGEKIFIRNYAPYEADGIFSGLAMKVGTITNGSQVLPLYDFGAPNIVPVIKTNKPPANEKPQPVKAGAV